VKIAVIEHMLRGSADEEALALAEACIAASEQQAEVVFLPASLPIDEEGAHKKLAAAVAGVPGTRLIPRISSGVRAQMFPVTDEIPVVGSRLGRAALLHGDACFDRAVLEQVAAGNPHVLIMTPMNENELQAEAMLELAIALSESVAGLVVIAEATGAEPGTAGHGGSAIVLLGEVLAESVGSGGEVLIAEVPEPLPLPEPPEPLPQVPTLLVQRLATHQGRRLDMGYPADLSDGSGPR
jgi:hypothetical protein